MTRLLDRANRFNAGNRPAAAVPLLQQAAQLDPANPRISFALGVACLNSGMLADAVGAFRQTVALRPDYPKAYGQLARTLDTLGMAGPAIESYRIALAQARGQPELHERLGELLLEANRDAEAVESFRTAAALAPNTTTGRLCTARLLIMEGDLVAASDALRRTAAIDPASAKAFELLGRIAGNKGGFGEALDCYRKALAANPRQVISYQSLVEAQKITRRDTDLLDRMQALLADGSITEPERLTLHFALGKAMDDLGEYETAIAHFDAANRVRTRRISLDREQIARRIDNTIAQFNPEFLAGKSPYASVDQRPVFIIGMPRSGTTLVEQILASHPVVAGGGELRFWLDQDVAWQRGGIDPLCSESAAQITAEFSTLLTSISTDAERVTDKLPFNFFRAGVLHRLYPNARIIHCRRHPVDTCISIYTRRFESPMTFGTDRGNLVFFYRQYERLMAHWRSVLPADRFMDVDYEALIDDPEPQMRRMVAFCGLEWNDACRRPELTERVVRTASYWQVRQPINRSGLERWRRYEPWLGELKELLPGE